VETFAFVRDNAKKAANLLVNFEVVVDCLLHYEPSRPKELFNGSEARFEYFSRILCRMSTGAGPDDPPADFYLYELDFKMPPAKQPKMEEKDSVVRAYEYAPTDQAIQKNSRKQAGTLNIHNLHFDPAELVGLLFEEPAINIQAVHADIPDGESAMRVDVEDEHGNRLFWDETGKSHVIFAFMKNAVRHYLKKPIQQRKKPSLSANGKKSEGQLDTSTSATGNKNEGQLDTSTSAAKALPTQNNGKQFKFSRDPHAGNAKQDSSTRSLILKVSTPVHADSNRSRKRKLEPEGGEEGQ
jgi:hypothetical protein